MTIGILGIKRGMTRVFTEAGESIPVTVIEATPNRVTQVKTPDKDGYSAVQVTAGSVKPSRVSKPAAGHFSSASVDAGRNLREFRTKADAEISIGDILGVDAFTQGQRVDVSGQSKGKGFAGVVKRYNFKMQDATHGNSLSHRAPGSIGQCQTPGRVFKGKKMAGHMGAVRVTAQTLEVVLVDEENNLLLLKGAVPGAKGGDVIITPAAKQGRETTPSLAAKTTQADDAAEGGKSKKRKKDGDGGKEDDTAKADKKDKADKTDDTAKAATDDKSDKQPQQSAPAEPSTTEPAAATTTSDEEKTS